MGVYTYITVAEREKWRTVEDADINELLQEVNQKFDNQYLIQTKGRIIKKLFKKASVKTFYSLYFGKGTEVMIINFCQEHDWSINTAVSKSYIITYSLGMLTGYEYAHRNYTYTKSF